MPLILVDDGFLTVAIRYVKALKKGGPLFYYRRIPEDVRAHYRGQQHIRKSLGTRELHVAARTAAKLAAEHDALWRALRSPEGQRAEVTTKESRDAARALLASRGLAPGDGFRDRNAPDDDFHELEVTFSAEYWHLKYEDRDAGPEDVEAVLSPVQKEARRLFFGEPTKPQALLSDAVDVYLSGHDKGHDPKFQADTRRATGHLLEIAGDLPLTLYERGHANAVREALLNAGNRTGTVRRRVNTIKAVFNVGLREFNLPTANNPFERLRIARETHDATTRESFTETELRTIAEACLRLRDDIRHLIAMQMDTGARLGEIVGLRSADVVLTGEIPHIHIRPLESLGRTLKTANSVRKVPLVGMALWGAERALEGSSGAAWLFPRYASDGAVKATYASNTINKWLREALRMEKTSHSFRHAMRDRLRHAEAPEAIQDAIGGWGSKSSGQGYGSEGYRLERLREYMERVAFIQQSSLRQAS